MHCCSFSTTSIIHYINILTFSAQHILMTFWFTASQDKNIRSIKKVLQQLWEAGLQADIKKIWVQHHWDKLFRYDSNNREHVNEL